MQPDAKVGWIGTGAMGSAMASRLAAAGLEVAVYNRTREKALKIAGAAVKDSPAEVARASVTVFLCLTGLAAGEEVLFGPSGVAAGARPGLTVVDTSTVGPDLAVAFGKRLEQTGIRYVDCPVSGGPEGARAGTLTAVLSGDAQAAEACRPLVARFAAKIHYVGGPGRAQMIKVLNNQAEGIHMIAAAEVIALGLAAGLELAPLRRVLADLRGYSKYMDLLFERLAQPPETASTSLEVRVKDLGLALELAKAKGVPAAATELAQSLYRKALERFGPAQDQSRCFDLIGKRPG